MGYLRPGRDVVATCVIFVLSVNLLTGSSVAERGGTPSPELATPPRPASAIKDAPTVSEPEIAASRRINILDFAQADHPVDRTGKRDASAALAAAIEAANALTFYAKDHAPQAACVIIPSGTYRIEKPMPMFRGAGCVQGDGPAQSVINLGPEFTGDLFAWAEAWIVYGTSGATVRGLRINGARDTTHTQNALMFYDRNDNILLADLYIDGVFGRALGTGLLRPQNSAGQAYIRESNLRNIKVFGCGRPDQPAVEFASQGGGHLDGTNEVSVSQLDIYGSRGPSLVIRNSGSSGTVRNLKFDALRIEGKENGQVHADLLQIGDPNLMGGVGHLSFTNLELIDPYPGFAAVRIASGGARGRDPSKIYIQGYIGGGLAKGEGLRIDSGSHIRAQLDQIRTEGTNVVIGPKVENVVIDGGGAEVDWTYEIDPSSEKAVTVPVRQPIRAVSKSHGGSH